MQQRRYGARWDFMPARVLLRASAIMALAFSHGMCALNPEKYAAAVEKIVSGTVGAPAPQKTPGLVVGVIRNGERAVFGYGSISAGNSSAPDGDTVYEIGSVTKVITGIILAHEVLRGAVRLTDTMAQYLPADVKTPSYDGQEVTLLDLATHTSGLPGGPDNYVSKTLNRAEGYTPRLLYDYLGRYTLRYRPGERYFYSSMGTGILSHLLERKNRMSYDELVAAIITRPLAMRSTMIAISPEMKGRIAPGYHAGTICPPNRIDTFEGSGALRSTANDMLILLSAFLESDTGVRAKECALVMRPNRKDIVSKKGEPGDIGLLLDIRSVNGTTVYEKSGVTGGYSSWIMFTREPKAAVVLLMNSSPMESSHAMAREVLALLNRE